MKTKSVKFGSLLAVLTLLLALPASALTNWATNGDFSSDVSGWTVGSGYNNGQLNHTTDPYHTSPGAAVLYNPFSSAQWVWACQCVDVTGWPDVGGERYYIYDGWIRSNGTTNARFDMNFYTDNSCETVTGSQITSEFTTSGDWTQRTIGHNLMPTNANSASICFAGEDIPSGGGSVYFDDLQFYPTGTTAVTLHALAARGGLWGGAALASVLACGLVLLRRRKGVSSTIRNS